MATNQSRLPVFVNGTAPSWTNFEATATEAGGVIVDFTGVKELNFDTGLERGKQLAGGRVIAETSGDVTNTANVVFYEAGALSIHTQLADIAKGLGHVRGPDVFIGQVRFDLHVQYEIKHENRVFEYLLEGCALNGFGQAGKEGPEALTSPHPLSVMQIARLLPDGTKVMIG